MGQEHKEYTWNLIARKLSGEATPEELRELEHLLRCNPELHYSVQTVTDLWNPTDTHDQQVAEEAFNRHVERMRDLHIDFQAAADEQESEATDPSQTIMVSSEALSVIEQSETPRRTSVMSWLAAASLIGLVATTAVLWTMNNRRQHFMRQAPGTIADVHTPEGNEIFTSNGSRTHIALPDGSVVYLNAGSRIKYEKNYGITNREVTLIGEAFFDVARNPGQPFIIHTARLDIRVLGTSFNVKSYPTDKTTETTLIKGSIEVSIHNRRQGKFILKPNEKLVVSNEDSSLREPSHSRQMPAEKDLISIGKPTYELNSGSIIETSWINNKLIFQDEKFDELASLMERWYGVTISFDNEKLKSLQFTGNFEKETLQQALDALTLTASFSYSIEGTQITIHEK